MTAATPMQLIDNFLLNYNVGQVVLLLFLLVLPVGIVKKSHKITGINVALFGVLFIVIPSIGGGSINYAFLGVALLVVGPMIYVNANR